MTVIASPRGTQDILPASWPLWRHVLDRAAETAESSGYERIEIPTFEQTALFMHATGEHTDVAREMYTFEDRGGERLSLRPEGTASVFRAYFQHGMRVQPQPVKLYYMGPMFRYERPQAGRFREHHQFGCEAIGSEDALLDSSLIRLQRDFYRSCHLRPFTIQINSIGDTECRPAFLRTLVEYLRKHAGELCADCRQRIERNPLRVLDCKVESCQPILDAAPRAVNALCDGCRNHWNRLREGLEVLGIDAALNPRLVRGLDYYTRTVWEFVPEVGGSAQSTIGGGGRYDALAQAIGGSPTPGVGFSTGLERVLLNISDDFAAQLGRSAVDIFVAHLGLEAEVEALRLTGELLCAGCRVDMAFGNRSLKSQMKQADGRGARLVVVIGDNELALRSATIRDLRTGEQQTVVFENVTETATALLGGQRTSPASNDAP